MNGWVSGCVFVWEGCIVWGEDVLCVGVSE